jgi:hypothetical protein
MKVITKIVGKTKLGRIRSQQIRESSGIQPINEWAERRSRGWAELKRIMDAERLVKISRDSIPARRSPGRPKIRWSDVISATKIMNQLWIQTLIPLLTLAMYSKLALKARNLV